MKKWIFLPKAWRKKPPIFLPILPSNPSPPRPAPAPLHRQLPHPVWPPPDNEMLCAGFYITQPGDRPGPC